MELDESLMGVWTMKILLRFRCDLCGRCARNLTSDELHHYDRSRSSRSAQDALENVLRVSGGVRRRAEYAHLPGLPRPAGRAAGDEPRSTAHDGADRADAGLRYRADLQVRPQKLFLSGHAEELSDLAIRHAVL